MSGRGVRAFAALLVLAAACGCGRSLDGGAPAELILRGGRVYVRPVQIQAEADEPAHTLWLVGGTAVACARGKIAYVGDDKGTSRFEGPRTKVVELHGATVLPGGWRLAASGTPSAEGSPRVLEPGSEAGMTVFSEDPFGERRGPGLPPVLFRVRGGEVESAFVDSPVGAL